MAEVVVVMSSDEQKLWRAQQRLIEQQTKMTRNYSRVKQEARAAGKEADDSFGAAAVSRIGAYASGLLTVGAAVAQITAGWRELEQTQQRALDSMQATASPERYLMQVAQGNTVEEVQADFRRMVQRADELAAMSSGMDRASARELVFNARSAGFEDALDFIASTGAVITPGSAGEVAGRGPRLFGEGVTPTQAIAGTLAAAEQAIFNFEQIAQALPSAALGGQAVGADARETLAVLSVFSDRLKSPLQAADMMNLFGATVARDEDLSRLGLVGAFRALQAMDPEERKGILGQSIGLAGFMRTMEAGMGDIQTRRDAIAAAMATAETPSSQIQLRREAMERERGDRLSVERERIRNEIAGESAVGGIASRREMTRLESERRFAESGGGASATLDRFMDRFGDVSEGLFMTLFGSAFVEDMHRRAVIESRQYMRPDQAGEAELREASANLRDAAQALRERGPDTPASAAAPVMQREVNAHSIGVE